VKTSRQLKDLIRNIVNDKSVEPHILMRSYMMERFLERISLSIYNTNFILKGGMLVASMVGLSARSTMDMDTTVKGIPISMESIEKIINEIITIPLNDGLSFTIKGISEIMEESEYSGVRISLESVFDGIKTPLKLDISTGDIITPKEIDYEYKLMFDDRDIHILAYNIETVLAEKLETIISRGITNTRIRDFYDVFTLQLLYSDRIDSIGFRNALMATSKKRGSYLILPDAENIFKEISIDIDMQRLWTDYQKKFKYALGIDWNDIINAVKKLYLTFNDKMTF